VRARTAAGKRLHIFWEVMLFLSKFRCLEGMQRLGSSQSSSPRNNSFLTAWHWRRH